MHQHPWLQEAIRSLARETEALVCFRIAATKHQDKLSALLCFALSLSLFPSLCALQAIVIGVTGQKRTSCLTQKFAIFAIPFLRLRILDVFSSSTEVCTQNSQLYQGKRSTQTPPKTVPQAVQHPSSQTASERLWTDSYKWLTQQEHPIMSDLLVLGLKVLGWPAIWITLNHTQDPLSFSVQYEYEPENAHL